jgi:hypothetical protein
MPTTASSVTTGGVLTVQSVADLMVGQTVRLTGTAFGGLVANRTYYIAATASSTITLTLTRGGVALVISGGTGLMGVIEGPRLGPGLNKIISTGSTDLASPLYGDFNTIQGMVAKVLGAPTNTEPRFGYNQLLLSSPVALGEKITLSHWANLRADMIKARGHQTGSGSEANNIALPTSTSKVTEALRLAYNNYAVTLTTFRDISGTAPIVQNVPETVSTAVRIDDWNNTITSTVTLNFGDIATARGFFNANGQIKVTVSLIGPFSVESTTKSNTWATMFSSMGTITINRNSTSLAVGSTGTPSNLGYFDLTTTDQQLFKKSAPSGFYTPNEFTINAKISEGAVILTMAYADLDVGNLTFANLPRTGTTYTDPANAQVIKTTVDEYIAGELRQVVSISRPSGSYVSIPTPIITLAGNLQGNSSFVFGMTADKYTINEGDTVTLTLTTKNIPDGSTYPYTVTGIAFDDLTSGFLSGSFTIFNNSGTQAWTFDSDLRTETQKTMIVALNNGAANSTILVNDTSRNPVGNQLFNQVGTGLQWIAPAGVRNVSVLIVAGGAGGQSFAGGGGGGGQVQIYNSPTTPLQTYFITVGGGGGAGGNGGNSSWGPSTVFGGLPGLSGTTTGAGGTHRGGTGGSTTNGGNGGLPSGNSGTTMLAAGGGGGGAGGGGGSAPNTFTGGNGGPGLIVSWFGNATLYVGGGGGAGATTRGGGGTFGSGSGGSIPATPAQAGTAGTGGGGGGGGATPSSSTIGGVLQGQPGNSGGSGLVWIQWS